MWNLGASVSHDRDGLAEFAAPRLLFASVDALLCGVKDKAGLGIFILARALCLQRLAEVRATVLTFDDIRWGSMTSRRQETSRFCMFDQCDLSKFIKV